MSVTRIKRSDSALSRLKGENDKLTQEERDYLLSIIYTDQFDSLKMIKQRSLLKLTQDEYDKAMEGIINNTGQAAKDMFKEYAYLIEPKFRQAIIDIVCTDSSLCCDTLLEHRKWLISKAEEDQLLESVITDPHESKNFFSKGIFYNNFVRLLPNSKRRRLLNSALSSSDACCYLINSILELAPNEQYLLFDTAIENQYLGVINRVINSLRNEKEESIYYHLIKEEQLEKMEAIRLMFELRK